MPSLVEIGIMVLGIKDGNVKSIQIYGRTVRRTDEQTDDGQQAIRKTHLSCLSALQSGDNSAWVDALGLL